MKPSERLLRWYTAHGRKLPWRNTRDPYKILVSEIMLQQTQVARVFVFYRTWLKRFPNWNSLSQASNADVIHAWAGLGYNKRALALRDIAKQVEKSTIPNSYEEWIALKGIGPYTASALSVFSLRKRAVPIDTNIRRFAGRFFLGTNYPQLNDDGEIYPIIQKELMQSRKFYDIPQAIFDLANEHCTKIPTCVSCPMRKDCKAAKSFLSGKVHVPKQMQKKTSEKKHRNKKFPDRIYRGRLVKVLRENNVVPISKIGKMIDSTFVEEHDQAWLQRMIDRLQKDGLLEKLRNGVQLPQS